MMSRIETSNAVASLSMLTIDTFRSPRSTLLTYVRCRPAFAARFSWEIPFEVRTSRSFAPNRTRTSSNCSVLCFTQNVDRESVRVQTLGLHSMSYRNS